MSFSYYYRGKLILCSTNFISSIPIFKTRRKLFRTIRFLVLTGPGPELLGNFSTPGYKNMLIFFILFRGRRDHMVFGFTTTYAIDAYRHYCCEFESRSGEGYLIQHFVIKFVSDLWQVNGFIRVLRFLPPIKLTAKIQLKYC